MVFIRSYYRIRFGRIENVRAHFRSKKLRLSARLIRNTWPSLRRGPFSFQFHVVGQLGGVGGYEAFQRFVERYGEPQRLLSLLCHAISAL